MNHLIAHRLDAAHWHERAVEARDLAERIPDCKVREQMFNVAASYDRLADRSRPTSKRASELERGASDRRMQL